MPKIPSAADYGYSAPTPQRGVVQSTPDPTGKVLMGFGDELGKLAAEETRKLEEVLANDALNKVRDLRLRRTLDPTTGFTREKGIAVTSGDFLGKYSTVFDNDVKGLTDAIQNPRVRDLVKTKAASEARGFREDVFRHMAAETTAMRATVFNGAIATDTNYATSYAADPIKRGAAIANIRSTAARQAEVEGIPADGGLRDVFVLGYVSQANTEVTKALVAAGRGIEAEEFYNKAEFTAKDRGALALAVAHSVLGSKSADIVTRLRNQPEEKDGENLTALAGKYDDSVLAHARVQLSDLRKDDKVKYESAAAVLFNTFDDGKTGGPKQAKIDQIVRSSEFGSLPAVYQQKLKEQMEQELNETQNQKYTQAAHARATRQEGRMTAAEREEKKLLDPKAQERFHDMLNDPGLAARPAGWGSSQIDVLGKTMAHQVDKAVQDAKNGVKTFRIPEDRLKEYLPHSKSQQAAFKGIVYTLTEAWRQDNPGTTMSEGEQLGVLKAAAGTYAKPGVLWGTNTRSVLELAPMPGDFAAAAKAAARRRGVTLTPGQILQLWSQQPGAKK